MRRLLVISLLGCSLAGCRDVGPGDLSGSWTLSAGIAADHLPGCTLSGTIDITGTTAGFRGVAIWTQTMVRDGVVEAQTFSHQVAGSRRPDGDPLEPPAYGVIEFIEPGAVVHTYLLAHEISSELMWGPWQCDGRHGNWFLQKGPGDGR